MRSKILLSLLALAAFSFTPAFAAEDANSQEASQTQAQNNNSEKDGEIIATLIILNKNEVAAAKAALKKNLSPSVKHYAQTLDKDHGKNLQDTMNLSHKIHVKPDQTSEVNSLKEQGKKDLADARPLSGQPFEVMFIDQMVKGHEDALNKIDQGMANTNNSQLKTHLEKTRKTIEEHLEKAKEIQKQLKSNG